MRLLLLVLVAGCAVGGDLDFDEDGFLDHADCDAEDPTIHPGAIDPFGDGIDSDCDGQDGFDGDGDGSPAGVDCDDGDPSVFPGALEIPQDTVDQNCDGLDLLAGPGPHCLGDLEGEFHTDLSVDLADWTAGTDVWRVEGGMATCEGTCSLSRLFPGDAVCWQMSLRTEIGPDCSAVELIAGPIPSLSLRPDDPPGLFLQTIQAWPEPVPLRRDRPHWVAVAHTARAFVAVLDGGRLPGAWPTGSAEAVGTGAIELRTVGTGCRIDRLHVVAWN